MSMFSGKCDLYDYMSMMKSYQHDGVIHSDELECFNIFKKKTGGKIYQTQHIPLTKYNMEMIRDMIASGTLITNIQEITITTGKTPYHIKYTVNKQVIEKDYTANQIDGLNHKIYCFYNREIPFESIFDLVPYYPYLVAQANMSPDSIHIVISSESYIKESYESALKYGKISKTCSMHAQDLQAHYLGLIKQYGDELFNPNYVYNDIAPTTEESI